MVRRASILFAAAALCLACRAPRRDAVSATPPRAATRWHALDAAARRDPRVRGVWEAEGYGHLVVIADDTRVFHATSTFCVPDPGLVLGFALYALGEDDTRLSLLHEDFGSASAELQSRVDLRRIAALPGRCTAPGAADTATPGAVFDALATLMDEHYAFFAERRVAWAPLRERYRPLAHRASDADSLFSLLREMLGHVNDGHLNLSRRGGPSFNAGQPALRERLVSSWRREGMSGTSGDYVSAWHQRVVGSVHPLLDAGSRRDGAAGALEWGTIGDSVAYVRVNRFSGFTRDDIPRPAQLDSLRAALDRMLADIGGKKAAIVDVSMNGGGMDAAAILVARRFADRERAALTKQVRGGASQTVIVRPEGDRQFTRPVVLLTSEITASAAEVFVLLMRALPHVTQVGEGTRGILSGLLPKPLPGGYVLTLSHQTVRDAEGRLFEGTGVPPREEVVLFPSGREATGLAEAIRGVADRLARAERPR
jgi:carboxyl-terminal processing protease